jgi:hypothetical protein
MTKSTSNPLPTRMAFGLLWLFVFTLPLTQATEIPGVGMISKVAGLMAIISGLIAVASRNEFRLLGTVHAIMAGFILWSIITLCWSVAPDLTVQRIVTYLQLFVLVLMVWEFCREEKEVLEILGAFVLGTMIPALSTLTGFIPGQQALIQRASAPGFDANSLAFILALSLPVAYYLILRVKSPVSALYRLQMGFAFCAIVLTGSVAAMIAMVVGLSLVFWTAHLVPVRTRTNVFALFLLLGAAVILFIPSSLWKHIAEESRNGGITLTAAVNTGFQSVRSTPIGGYGAGSMAAPASHTLPSHQANFTVFSEIGVVGVACFIAIFGVLFLEAEGMSGATKSFWFTVLAVWTFSVCCRNWDCSPSAWLLFGLLAAHSACLNREAVTEPECEQKRSYYVEKGAQVWS